MTPEEQEEDRKLRQDVKTLKQDVKNIKDAIGFVEPTDVDDKPEVDSPLLDSLNVEAPAAETKAPDSAETPAAVQPEAPAADAPQQ